MKKRNFLLMLAMVCAFAAVGCGGNEEPAVTDDVAVEDTAEVTDESEDKEVVEDLNIPEGYYRSELTGEIISEELKDQRPVAIMVDNESIALPHYGLTDADIIYEMMNSTKNGRITRFMCLFKDWEAIERVGSIRSVRPTNFLMAAEYNAVLVHDGGPYHIDAYQKEPYSANFSGGFARIDNGKSREFTEYVTTGELAERFENSSYSRTYNEYYEGQNFEFATEANPVDLSEDSDSIVANFVDLPYEHNKSELTYNEEDGLYYYSEYGSAHKDPGNDNKQLSFKNLIIQYCSFNQLDENGYMIFNCIGQGLPAFYVTNGHAELVFWEKLSPTSPTVYRDEDGVEITLNVGKTYIGFVPDDNWDDLVIE